MTPERLFFLATHDPTDLTEALIWLDECVDELSALVEPRPVVEPEPVKYACTDAHLAFIKGAGG